MRKKNKLLILILSLSFVVALVVLVFSYFKFNKDFISMRDLSSLVFEYSKQSEQIANLRSNSEKFSRDIERVNGYLIDKEGEVYFIEELESLAKKNNLNIVINSVLIEEKKELMLEGIEYLTLNFRTEGSWDGTFRFLYLLENMPYDIYIEKAGLVYKNDSKDIKLALVDSWQTLFSIKVLKKTK